LDGGGLTETGVHFDTVEQALAEAHRALAEMAADGLPNPPLNMISLELLDEHRKPIREMRLIFEEIDKT
jgi:hypothetical protein